MRTFAQKQRTIQSITPIVKTLTFARPHFREGRDTILNLQHLIGDQAPHQLLNNHETNSNMTSSGSFGHDFSRIPLNAKPSVKIYVIPSPVAMSNPGPGDKITQHDQPKADQSIATTSVAPTGKGLNVSADAVGLFSSADFPDGFRWLQTVTTNDPSNTPVGAPLLPAPITYVDPLPNDDSKPFYWTDAEETKNIGHFEDKPGRPAHPTGTISWNAILSLGGVNEKEVTRFDSVAYGFSLDSKGTVSVNGPSSPASVASHIGTLSAEFPGWRFK